MRITAGFPTSASIQLSGQRSARETLRWQCFSNKSCPLWPYVDLGSALRVRLVYDNSQSLFGLSTNSTAILHCFFVGRSSGLHLWSTAPMTLGSQILASKAKVLHMSTTEPCNLMCLWLFDQMVIYLVRSEIAFIRSGRAYRVQSRAFPSIVLRHLEIDLSTAVVEPSFPYGAGADFNLSSLISSKKLTRLINFNPLARARSLRGWKRCHRALNSAHTTWKIEFKMPQHVSRIPCLFAMSLTLLWNPKVWPVIHLCDGPQTPS